MSGKTVLIADDDSAIRTVLSQALSRAGYAVRSTATAGALWRWVTEGQGDAVITDEVAAKNAAARPSTRTPFRL